MFEINFMDCDESGITVKMSWEAVRYFNPTDSGMSDEEMYEDLMRLCKDPNGKEELSKAMTEYYLEEIEKKS